MKTLKITAAALVLAGFGSAAQAQDTGAYVNIGVDAVEFDAYTLSAKLGYDFSENFAVEGQAGFGIIDDDQAGFDVGVDSTFAGFAKGSIPAGENFDLFARVGYHFTQYGVDGVGSIDTDGFAAGAGGEYFFTPTDGIRAEYTYYDVDDVDTGADVFSLSYVRKF